VPYCRRGFLEWHLFSTAPLKNECVKAPGMTASDGRGSIVKAGGQLHFNVVSRRSSSPWTGRGPMGTPCGHGSVRVQTGDMSYTLLKMTVWVQEPAMDLGVQLIQEYDEGESFAAMARGRNAEWNPEKYSSCLLCSRSDTVELEFRAVTRSGGRLSG